MEELKFNQLVREHEKFAIEKKRLKINPLFV